MATSSITHNFVVSNPKSVKCFVNALEEVEHDCTPKQTLPGHQLADPKEILALMATRKNLLSDFSCPKKPDVKYFLLHNAIEFTKYPISNTPWVELWNFSNVKTMSFS